MSQTIIDSFIAEGLKGKAAQTVKTYSHALSKFNEWLEGSGTDLQGYARTDVQQYIDYLTSKKKSASTINTIWNAIKTFSKWTDKREAIEDIRVVKPKDLKQEAPKSLSKTERNALIREIDRSGNKRDYAIIMTLLHTGLRVSELVSLDRSDVEMSERKGELTVRSGKGNKERVIPLSAEARRALVKYLEERTDSQPALFLSNRQDRISIRTVQYIVEQQGFNVHALRHTFITGLVRSGQDISVVKSLSGHASADMVMRYSQPTEEDKRQAIENLFNS
jgi:site-specific recombinase XerD